MSCDVWTALCVHARIGKTFGSQQSQAQMCFHECFHVTFSCQSTCECFLKCVFLFHWKIFVS